VTTIDPSLMSDRTLLRYIMVTYHAPHLHALPRLRAATAGLSAVVIGEKSRLGALEIALRQLEFLLTHHQRKEETRLFPLIVRGDYAAASASAAEMSREHEQLDALLTRLSELTDGFRTEDPALERLWAALRSLHDAAVEHHRLEETVLFPRFRKEEESP